MLDKDTRIVWEEPCQAIPTTRHNDERKPGFDQHVKESIIHHTDEMDWGSFSLWHFGQTYVCVHTYTRTVHNMDKVAPPTLQTRSNGRPLLRKPRTTSLGSGMKSQPSSQNPPNPAQRALHSEKCTPDNA